MKSPLMIRRVVGQSMWPTLKEGDLLITSTWKKPRLGSIVTARVDGKELVKRIVDINGGKCKLQGDNYYHSFDSRNFGLVDKNCIYGVVLGYPPSVNGHVRFVTDSA